MWDIAWASVATVKYKQENVVEKDEETNNTLCLILKLIRIVNFKYQQYDQYYLSDNKQSREDQREVLQDLDDLVLISLV